MFDVDPARERRQQQLSALVHMFLTDEETPDRDRAALRRLQARVGTGRRWWWGARLPAFGALAVAATVAIAVAVDDDISYQIEGGHAAADGTIAGDGGGARLAFSDGTAVVFEATSWGRVVAAGARGARVALDDGAARITVAPRPRAQWTVEAGPFSVDVTGTAFDLRWSRRDQALDLRLHEGSVIVRGPLAGAGVAMHAGQRLVAVLPTNTFQLAPITPAPVGSAPPAAAGEAPDAPATVGPRPAERPAPPRTAAVRLEPAPTLSWARRVAAGDHAGVLRDAEKRGLKTVLAQASTGDLAALADAARYAGRDDVARRALEVQRRRFPGTPHARDAAFLLGRLADDGADDPARALSWYDRYLVESADGSYASEALGRKMNALKRTAGRERACPVAQEYLRRYPNGPYARVAESLCPEK